MHSETNISRKYKTSYNLKWMTYYLGHQHGLQSEILATVSMKI